MTTTRLKRILIHAAHYLRSLARNAYFWGGLTFFVGVLLAVYLVVDNVIMPSVTRQDVSVTVPNVINQPFEHARLELERRQLSVEALVQRYNPNFPRDVVVDQNPPADAAVKHGRRVYVTVNSGELQRVRVPSVEGFSLREAINRLTAQGLDVVETLPDSIPAPNPNTVTRQRPMAGDSVVEGSAVTLWFATGLGREYVTIPDVTGLTVEEAQETLLATHLRSIVIGADEEGGATAAEVVRQSREPGTRVPAGFELRLYLHEEAAAMPPQGLPATP